VSINSEEVHTAEREFLAWKTGLEAARRAWRDAPDGAKNDALLMGFPLAQAEEWLAQRAEDLPQADREFVESSVRRDFLERRQREGLRRRAWQMGTLAGVLLLGIGAGLAWSSRDYFKALAVTSADMVWPKVLTVEAEHALQPGQIFTECTYCPEMVVVPAGEFMMGSIRSPRSGPLRKSRSRRFTSDNASRSPGSRSRSRSGTPASHLAGAPLGHGTRETNAAGARWST
jgi:hypothetical protein